MEDKYYLTFKANQRLLKCPFCERTKFEKKHNDRNDSIYYLCLGCGDAAYTPERFHEHKVKELEKDLMKCIVEFVNKKARELTKAFHMILEWILCLSLQRQLKELWEKHHE